MFVARHKAGEVSMTQVVKGLGSYVVRGLGSSSSSLWGLIPKVIRSL